MNEGKQLAAAIQAEIVRAQAAILGERFRCCEHSGAKRWSKDCYPATFHSAFRNVPVKIRRLSASRCRSGSQEAKSFAAMMAAGGIGPKLAHEDAARRLRRWPIAILDRGCAQRAAEIRPGQRNGPGQPNKETSPASPTPKRKGSLLDADMECAPAGGQVGRLGLTPVAGLPEDGSHDEAPIPHRSVQAAGR